MVAPPRDQVAATSVDLGSSGDPLNYSAAVHPSHPESAQWQQAGDEEWIRLHDTTGTISWIPHADKPTGEKATYYNPQVKSKIKGDPPTKTYRVRGTAGGDRVTYDGPLAADAASLTMVKTHLNSVVSSPGAQFMCLDIKDFYLGTPMITAVYMRVHRKHISAAIIAKYGLEALFSGDFIMVRINKGMYGLPQAGRLSRDRLVAHLAKHDYLEAPNTPSYFRHRTNNVSFTLVVDDFGVKYYDRAGPQHLIIALQELYILSIDWTGAKYIGLSITHDTVAHTLTIAMPGYVAKALARFNHTTHRLTHSASVYVPPTYGSTAPQLAVADASAPLSPTAITRVQQVVGVFLWYARAVDPTMMCPVNKISARQATPTVALADAVDRLLDYAASYPNASITYHRSDMVLRCVSDASYLSESLARSRAGGIHYMGTAALADTSINGSIECISTIIPTVVGSAAEAEYAALYINGGTAAGHRTTLTDMGHAQPPTIIQCDNSCATGIANGAAKQRKSKAIDMRYHWIRDRVRQAQFAIHWRPGKTNLADYLTKDLPVHIVRTLRQYFVTTIANIPRTVPHYPPR